jgi:hypothetical protein
VYNEVKTAVGHLVIPPNPITLGTKIMTTVAELVALANTDYDAFWVALSDHDRALTKVLTHESEYDAIAIIDNEVIEFCSDNTGCTYSRCLGRETDLVVYVNSELTGITDPTELDEFIEELADRLDPIPVNLGQSSSGNSAVEWLRTNTLVERAWDASYSS